VIFRRLTFWIVLLFAIGVITAVRVAGIHVGNQNFVAEPSFFDAAPVTQTALSPQLNRAPVVLHGQVSSEDGQPVAGATITAGDMAGRYRLSVFSDADGRFRLRANLAREAIIRVRALGYADVERELESVGELTGSYDFALIAIGDGEARAEAAVASGHAALLDWPDKEVNAAFVSQCHYCHQIGNALTRSPREAEDWEDVVDRMEGYLVLLSNDHKRRITRTLSETFTGDQRPAPQSHQFSPLLAQAKIEEWTAGDGFSFIHDSDVGADGRLYGVDEGHDVMWILDRDNGQVDMVPFPPSDLPEGGLFSGLALPIGIFTGQHGPHSLAQGADGRFWITNALSSTLMSYDPASGQFAIYPIGHDALYPHTIRIDGQGIVWFTLAASNQVGRFDPETAGFTLIELPSNGLSRRITDAFLPLILKIASLVPRANLHIPLSHYKLTGEGRQVLNMPYGIDVNPIDGAVWYSKLYANRIGRIDPRTLAVSEWDTPLAGPRRPRFGRDGILWIPSFDDSAILSFDPDTGVFREYRLPLLAEGEYETPYALNLHPETGDVWITSNLSDRIFRFDPGSESFVSYPSPTRVTFLRDLVFTPDGAICSSQSNLPAYAIEGGVPGFICITP